MEHFAIEGDEGNGGAMGGDVALGSGEVGHDVHVAEHALEERT